MGPGDQLGGPGLAEAGPGPAGGRGGCSRLPRPPRVPALGLAGAAAQWQEAGLRALSGWRRRPPLPPAAMGTGPGVSGRRAASRPGLGMPSRYSAPCWARGCTRNAKGQVRGGGNQVGMGHTGAELPAQSPAHRGAWGPGMFTPPRHQGGQGVEVVHPPTRSFVSGAALGPRDTPVGPRPCPWLPLPLSFLCPGPATRLLLLPPALVLGCGEEATSSAPSPWEVALTLLPTGPLLYL